MEGIIDNSKLMWCAQAYCEYLNFQKYYSERPIAVNSLKLLLLVSKPPSEAFVEPLGEHL